MLCYAAGTSGPAGCWARRSSSSCSRSSTRSRQSLWLCSRRQTRRAGPLVTGAALAVGTIGLPFALLAPGAFWHDVVTVQLGRPLAGATSPMARLSDLLSLSSMLGHPASYGVVATVTVGLPLALFLLTKSRDDARLWVLVAVGTVVAFLAASSHFPHYAGFLAPALAALTGLGLAKVRLHHPQLLDAALIGIVLALTAAAAGTLRGLQPQPAVASAVARYSTAGCAFSDSPSLLIAADRWRTPSTNCPGWVDPRGAAIALLHSSRERHFYPAGFRQIGGWQQQCRAALGHADMLVLTADLRSNPMLADDAREYAVAHFERVATSGSRAPTWELWIRRKAS